MRISYVRIFVIDLAAAKKFYAQTLGLNILWEYENKAIGFDLGPVLIVEQVSSEEDREERHLAAATLDARLKLRIFKPPIPNSRPRAYILPLHPKSRSGAARSRISKTPPETS